MNGYLKLIRKSYFAIFNAGLLKTNPVYDWHYFVQNLIKRGDVILDIGANMGYYSCLFSKLTGNRGKVYSIEPVAPLVKQLKKQIKRKKNITVLPLALGNENKDEVCLGLPEGIRKTGYIQHGLFSIQDPQGLKENKFVFGAAQRKGSEVFSGLTRIDYIKCDVEGYEKVILKDMEPLLVRHQPMVQVEIRNDHFTELISFFKKIGYRAFKLDAKKLVTLEGLSSAQQRHFDTLFVPPRHFTRIKPFTGHIDPKPINTSTCKIRPAENQSIFFYRNPSSHHNLPQANKADG
ncbi:hypothetical protein GCM10023143_16630 [Compostibacter hankyongensis]|uniref:Methyltransferase FkbM domain-containing protein n=1 Tax=Compostibacter hankyongensis TaxID=1007089 RepID=A0ABP8FQV0_9BACT